MSLGVGPEVRVGVGLAARCVDAGGADGSAQGRWRLRAAATRTTRPSSVGCMLDDSAARVLISERAVLDALAVDGARSRACCSMS
ncbi:hypothetical protein [Pseudomonas sp. BNK-44-a]|uniref:hypothetical protein n=1 Tax=Pseudomonas sp. BNK-44-a TaxID=3376178 RepID=UPI0039BF42F8